jgi:DNA polymerase-1
VLVTTQTQFQNLIARLNEAKWFAFDTETTGLSPYTGDRIIGMSFAIPSKDASLDTWYIPFRHERGHRLNFKTKDLAFFQQPFADNRKTVVTWNGKFDLHFLSVDGIGVQARVLDAMLAWHLCDENLFSYGLKDLAKSKLGTGEVQDDKDLVTLLRSEKMDKGKMAELSPIEAAPYAESDAELTWRMFRVAMRKLQADELVDLYYQVCTYARVLERCERKGIKIDPARCEELIETAQSRDAELLVELRKLAGEDFNPNSHPQCRKWLGLSSTAKEFLLEIEDSVPGVVELLEYRGHAKALSSFYLPFRNRRDRFNRVHASFRLHGTVTGRLSCSEPNLQNLPRKSAQWAKVKEMVVPANGYKLMEADLSQAEFRVLAHYVKDPGLTEAYCSGDADMHQYLADELGIDRQRAKTLNFALLYGGGVRTIKAQLSLTERKAQDLLDSYHARIPNLKKLSYALQRQAEGKGFIELWTGRRRRFPYVNGVRYDTHKALNSLIQGGAAEIVRHAMCSLDVTLPEGVSMLAQIHDSILLEVPNKLVPHVGKMVKETLENVAAFRVPITADVKVGRSWGSMEELKS